MVTAKQKQYLQAMGIQSWIARNQPEKMTSPALECCELVAVNELECTDHTAALHSNAAPTHLSQYDLNTLASCVASCTACGLHKTRTQTVFGVGNPHADLLIVGEAPGANEDRLGQPFVGRAGHLLDAMLKAIGFDRQQVYIANILKCRPPQNRDPSPEEVAQCTPFLTRQIELIQPKLILAVGRIAAHYLLKTTSSLTSLRGRLHQYGQPAIPLMITYHPAYLLRSPQEKRKAFEDLQKVSTLLKKG